MSHFAGFAIYLIGTLMFMPALTYAGEPECVCAVGCRSNREKVEVFIRTLYDDYVFGDKNFEEVKPFMPLSLVNRMQGIYKEETDGQGYAVWLLRSGLQDGPSEVNRVDTVIPEAAGWYRVRFTDMGNKGEHSYKALVRDGQVFVEDFR